MKMPIIGKILLLMQFANVWSCQQEGPVKSERGQDRRNRSPQSDGLPAFNTEIRVAPPAVSQTTKKKQSTAPQESKGQEPANDQPEAETPKLPPVSPQTEVPCKQVTTLTYPLVMEELTCFKKVADLMQALPSYFKDYYVLAHQTLSTRASASLSEPRIILYAPDGQSLIGITTSANDPKREMIEFAQLNTTTGFWDFKEITLGGTKPEISKEADCTPCHGNPLRPIWGTFPLWPNFYGSGVPTNDDSRRFSHLTPEQASTLNTLVPNKANHDRFKYLNIAGTFFAAGVTFALPTNSFREINVVFTNMLSWAHAKSLVLRMKASPQFNRYRKALLSTAFCQGSPQVNQLLTTRLATDHKLKYQGQILADYEKIYEVMGLDVRNDFQLYRRNSDPVSPYDNLREIPAMFQTARTANCESCFFQGGAYLTDLVEYYLLFEYLKANAAQAAMFTPVMPAMERFVRYTYTEGVEARNEFNKTNYILSSDVRNVGGYLTSNLQVKTSFCAALNAEVATDLN